MVTIYRIWNLELWSTRDLYGDVIDEQVANGEVLIEDELLRYYYSSYSTNYKGEV